VLDEELFKDPNSNTGEDLFFELQFATRGYFAFSCEVTAVHWFHNTNSTVIDSHRHESDYFRHALHFLCRAFPIMTPYRARFYTDDGQMQIPYTFISESLYSGAKQIEYRNLFRSFLLIWRNEGFRSAVRQTLLYIHSRI